MNSQEAVLDKINKIEAEIIQRLEIMDKCFNIEEKLNETVNSYIDGEKNQYFEDVAEALQDIPNFDTLKNEIELAIKDLTKKVEGSDNSDNLDLISLICDCLQFIRSIFLSIRLKDSLNNYKNEIIMVNSAHIDAFEKIRIKLNSDLSEKTDVYFAEIKKNLSWLEFDRISDNNYEKLIKFNMSILFLEKQALADHNKNVDLNVDLIDSLNEIEDEINDKIELAKEYVSERSEELILIRENLIILLNDFDSKINVDTIELLNKNKEQLVELQPGNTIDYIKSQNFEMQLMNLK